jgi:predicted acetyltransferase
LIRILQKQDFEQAANIVALAYPGMNLQTTEDKIKFVERLTTEQAEENGIDYFGYFNETEELLGIYRLNDFECNVNGKFQHVFGIGMVAVHLLHKKEKIAFQLLSHFHQYARQENVALVSLYPFNPSFYRKMGYGYGPMKYEYKIKPDAFIANGDKGLVKFLSPNDEVAIVDLYNEYALQNHGMFKRTWSERRLIKNAATNYVGVVENDKLIGALAFTLQPVKDSHFLHQHMIVYEWIWSTPNAYKQLASWLFSQQDQVERIIFRTNDQSFLYALANPLNGSNHLIHSIYHEVATAGTGLMYRITNIDAFVKEMNFVNNRRPDGFTRLLLEIEDTFLIEQSGTYEFIYNGDFWSSSKLINTNEEVNIKIGIHDLSSWWMGCVSLEALHKFGEVNVNNIDINLLDSWFKPNSSPICFTSF